MDREKLERGSAEEAGYFFAEGVKYGLFALQDRIDALEQAFLAEHPKTRLPDLPADPDQADFIAWATERGLV